MSETYTPEINERLTPKEEQETYISNSESISCRTPIIYRIIIGLIFSLLLGIIFLFVTIYKFIHKNFKLDDIEFIFLSIIFIFTSIILSYKFNLYLSIKVDRKLEIVYIKRIKLFFFIFKSKKIEIKNISNVIIRDNPCELVMCKTKFYKFEIIFNLLDGNKIMFNTIVKEPKREGNKFYSILSNTFPKNIKIENNTTF